MATAKSPLMTELAAVLNRHSAENDSDTPDYILADYLLDCLDTFARTTRQRDKWYGFDQTLREKRSREIK